MTSFTIAGLFVTGLLMIGHPARSQEAAACDATTDRCSSMARLMTEADETFATVTLQIDRSGANPILLVTAPLGIAARPGARLILEPGSAEIPLPLDVCFPDGCRASAELSAAQLSQLAEARSLSVQFIPFSSGETVAGDLGSEDLTAPLRQAGVTLP